MPSTTRRREDARTKSFSAVVAARVRERAQVSAGAVGDEGLAEDVLGFETPIFTDPDGRAHLAVDFANMFQ